ncbi:MAG: acetyl-CoA hydrolase, partial [Candidatus Phocaeicola faecipullorum]|nr:acetyl-CoA hydrolase [Candidatus Phocaeicola faecipullorum]
MSYKFMTAAEAASLINDGDIIGLSGFTPAGTPKAVTAELAKMAEEKHARGEHFKVSVLTGASTGDSCDGVLIRANALDFRAPYTTNADFRKACNNGQVKYSDIHLSQMAQRIRSGFLGKVNVAIMEACELTADGRIYLTAGVGISPTVARLAEKVIVELNAAHNKTSLMGMHDIYELERPPHRRPIMTEHASDRIGTPYIQVDPAKIAAVVEVNIPDEARGFHDPDPITDKIGQNVADFLVNDLRKGTIPSTFLPLQSGVGNIANAVLSALGKNPDVPAFEMYTEVIQNSVIDLVKTGRIKFGSTCSLSVTNDCLQDIYDNIEFFRDKLVLRP